MFDVSGWKHAVFWDSPNALAGGIPRYLCQRSVCSSRPVSVFLLLHHPRIRNNQTVEPDWPVQRHGAMVKITGRVLGCWSTYYVRSPPIYQWWLMRNDWMVQFNTSKDLDSRNVMRNVDLVLDVENVEFEFSKSLLASGNKNSRLPIGNFAAVFLYVWFLFCRWPSEPLTVSPSCDTKCVRKA